LSSSSSSSSSSFASTTLGDPSLTAGLGSSLGFLGVLGTGHKGPVTALAALNRRRAQPSAIPDEGGAGESDDGAAAAVAAVVTVMVVSCGVDNLVKVWDLATKELKQTLRGHTDRVRARKQRPFGRTVRQGSLWWT